MTIQTKAPNLLAVVRTSATSVKVTWENQAHTDATYTHVYLFIRELPSGTWRQANRWHPTPTVAVHGHDINASSGFEFRMQATGMAGPSPYSNVRSVGAWQEVPLSPHEVTATLLDNGRVEVNWTNRSTESAPYKYLYLFRSDDGGAYKQIQRLTMPANPGPTYPNPTKYIDSPGDNKKVAYRLWATNDAGGDRYHGPISPAILTRPSAPTKVGLSWSSAGLQVSWQRNARYVGRYEVEHIIEGGEWTAQAFVNDGKWLMPSPGASASRRKMRVRAAADGGPVSAWTESAWLPGAAPPLAPVALASHPQDATRPSVFAWTHLPLDGSVQTQWQIRYRRVGASTWTTISGYGSSETTEHNLSMSNGSDVEWQVATRGSQTVGFSIWSASQILKLRPAPSVTVTSPSAPTLRTSDLEVDWMVAGELSWEVVVLDRVSGAILARASGTGAHNGPALFPRLLTDGQQIAVHVDAVTNVGRATTGIAQTEVELERPAAPVIDVTVDHAGGRVLLSATPGSGSAVPTDEIRWLRSEDGGESWELVGTQETLSGSLTDWTPPTNTDRLRYIAQAWNGTQSSQSSDPVNAYVRNRDTWLSWGDDYRNTVRAGRISINGEAGREVEAHTFVGRDEVVFFRGGRKIRQHSVSILIRELQGDDLTPRWAEAASHDGLTVLRDASGRRLVGQVSDFKWEDQSPAPDFSTVTFTFTERRR